MTITTAGLYGDQYALPATAIPRGLIAQVLEDLESSSQLVAREYSIDELSQYNHPPARFLHFWPTFHIVTTVFVRSATKNIP